MRIPSRSTSTAAIPMTNFGTCMRTQMPRRSCSTAPAPSSALPKAKTPQSDLLGGFGEAEPAEAEGVGDDEHA